MGKRKLNILVLAGGESAEREVSIDSSRAIAVSLAKSGHLVRVIDTLNGRYLTDKAGKLLDEKSDEKDMPSDTNEVQVFSSLLPSEKVLKTADGGIDVVFNGLHGGKGENGTVQAVLDTLRIAYTGAPMAASAIAMNKDISKRIMNSLGIATAEWSTYDSSRGHATDDIIADFENKRLPSLPLIIKPADSGSTVGLSLVEKADQLPEAIKLAFAESNLVMVEDYIEGREITIAVLDGKALPPVEIKPTHKLYDYTCKYTKGKSEYFCPADIDAAIVKKLSDDAVLFYDTIGCRGYGRVDFIVRPDGSYVCLELNTLPGMTELSLFPMAAKVAGIGFDELLEKLCYLALE
jgi:D-alanine-D-alanine ligase